MWKRVLALGLLVCTSSVAFGAELEDVEATKRLSQKAASLIAEGKVKEAFQVFRDYWPIPPHEVDALIYQMESQRAPMVTRFGKSLSIELVTEEQIGESFIRYVYLEKYERHAIAWLFTFYRPRDKWIVNAVMFTPQLEPLFTPRRTTPREEEARGRLPNPAPSRFRPALRLSTVTTENVSRAHAGPCKALSRPVVWTLDP